MQTFSNTHRLCCIFVQSFLFVILPQKLVDSLQGVPGFDEPAFRHVHENSAQVTSIRINPTKLRNEETIMQTFRSRYPDLVLSKVPWSRYGYYLSQRPSFTFDPLFHAGCYYVQEASSLFLEQALKQSVDLTQPLNVLDLCAAPGGKSTHLQSLLSSESLLVSNEVIRNRATVLKQNLVKWGSENVVVTANDPQQVGRLDGFFDVLIVDAPCSGSGLFRRDAEAIAEWSEGAVQLCCGRQKRILADVFPSLKENGILIYSTCSYSREEDEDIADWIGKTLQMENVALNVKNEWNIITSLSETGAKGYRFFPNKVQGEGFYLTVFRKKTPTAQTRFKSAKPELATANEKAVMQPWLRDETLEIFRAPYLHGLLKNIAADYAFLKNQLHILYAGIAIGAVLKEKLVPDHALAVSNHLSPSVPVTDVDYDTAILYLQRNDIRLQTTKGWTVVSYNGHNLGWINALPNRINNYYPKELRILKQRPGSGFEK